PTEPTKADKPTEQPAAAADAEAAMAAQREAMMAKRREALEAARRRLAEQHADGVVIEGPIMVTPEGESP
ncbi:MAG: hypothetical protein CMJ49_09390, partial [Planctomycetaceae bacterium]|nr:hypothetical protein [Planctomycetaceae bacterium]